MNKTQKHLNRTGIEWSDYVWNPITGCSPVSSGCAHCYAARFARRARGRFGYPHDEPFRPTFHPERIWAPMSHRGPGMVFVGSMGDLFHADFADEQIDQVFAIMGLCGRHIVEAHDWPDEYLDKEHPGLTFLLLTKRPERMAQYLRSSDRSYDWEQAILRLFGPECGVEQDLFSAFVGKEIVPPNVWLGVSAENQQCLEQRLPALLRIPTDRRFLSLEPLLGPIRLHYGPCAVCPDRNAWVNAGPETGPGARPCDPKWIEDLRDECGRSGVPLLIKDAAPEDLRQRQFPVGLEPLRKGKPNG